MLAMLLGGGSVGREGSTVQLSAAVMVWISRVLRMPIDAGVLMHYGLAKPFMRATEAGG